LCRSGAGLGVVLLFLFVVIDEVLAGCDAGDGVLEGPVFLAHDEDLGFGVLVLEDLDQVAYFHSAVLLRVGGVCRSQGHTGVASRTAQGDSTRKSTSLSPRELAENSGECGGLMWSGTCIGDGVAR